MYSHPPCLPPFGYTPVSMRKPDVVRWSVWQKQPNGRKIPRRVIENDAWTCRKPCKSNDPSTWVAFREALRTYFQAQGALNGLTFALGDGWCGFDFDDCIVDETLDPQASSWLARLGGYQEISQSGKGVKAILKGRLDAEFLRDPTKTGRQFKGVPKDGMAVEIYDKRRFFFLTGTGAGNPLLGIPQGGLDYLCKEIESLYPRKNKYSPPAQASGVQPQKHKTPTLELAREVLSFIPTDAPYEEWRNVGMGIKDAGLPFTVWEEWCGGRRRRSTGEWVDGECVKHWNAFNSSGITWGSVVYYAYEGGYRKQREYIVGGHYNENV